MTSISKPLTFAQAQDYLQRENYHQKNSEKGFYFGSEKMLEKLGLTQGQEVDTVTYLHLLKAYNPETGEPLLRNSDDENRRVGIDVVNSAPKSVSIVEEYLRATGKIEEADKIREATFKANQIAMDKALEYATTRVYDENGNRVHTNEVETIRATFEHDTSRENKVNGTMDMQLHHHNMIFNLVMHKDKFYSLSNEEIYKQKMLIGQVYRNELASNMKNLGYEIEVVDYEKGFFEIKGIERDIVENFSGRSQDILALVDKYREKYPNMKQEALEEMISQTEKIAKRDDVDRDELLQENLERMLKVGLTDDFINSLKKPINEIGNEKQLNIDEMQTHIYNSLKFLEENNSTFTKEDILKETLKYGIDKGYTIKDYESIFKENDYIVEFENEIFSTHTVVEAERNVIDNINDKNYSISEKFGFGQKEIDDFLNSTKFKGFTKGQKEMFENILKSDYQYTIIQGNAGTGKTWSMEALNEFLKDKDIEIKGMSFTGKASENLQKDSQIQSDTVAKFIIEEMKNKSDIQKERLLIVDEAGMLGSLDFAKLQEIAKKNNDKLILVGDKKQLTAVSQGKLFFETQNHSKNIVFLDEAQRFKTDHAKDIVNKAIEKNLSDSFKILDQKKGLKEMDKDEQIKSITEDFVNQSNKKRENTGIIASLNADKKALNESIRTALKMEDNAIKFKVKESVDLKGVAKKYNTSYEKDMLLTISKKIEGFKIGETVKIIGTDKNDKTKVLVVNSNGNVKPFNLNENSNNFNVYKEVEKSLSQGEIIKFNKNVKSNGIDVKNGERGTIKTLSESGDVELTNGKKFNLNKMNFVDYGYVYSVHEAQGQTFPVTIAMIDSKMNNYEANYSALTRMKYHIKIYTDNKEDLIKNASKNQEKASTVGLKKVEKYETNHKFKESHQIAELGKNKVEKYTANLPIKKVQNLENYGIIPKQIKGDKNEKISSIRRIERRLSKPVIVKVRGKIVTNTRNNMRVLSAIEMAVKRRAKLLLPTNAHNSLEQSNTRQSDVILRRANSSNKGAERTANVVKEVQKQNEQMQEIQKQRQRGGRDI